jgi:hypothetical protein
VRFKYFRSQKRIRKISNQGGDQEPEFYPFYKKSHRI